ncbi:MAG: hypothetical protein V4757_05575 [Pseudomonadota bacterium]
MSLLLSLRGLPMPEATLIKTIIRLSSELHGRWTVVDSQSGNQPHLEFRDSAVDAGTAPGGMPWGHSRIIKVLPRGEAADGDSLRRPIRAEEVIAMLKSAEQLPLAGAPFADDQPPAAPSMEYASAKLIRWPPARVLSGDARRIRMATMLARQSLSVSQLGSMTQCSLAECERFLQDLRSEGLLELSAPEGIAVPVTRPESPAVPGARLGFIQRLRRKLGITTYAS